MGLGLLEAHSVDGHKKMTLNDETSSIPVVEPGGPGAGIQRSMKRRSVLIELPTRTSSRRNRNGADQREQLLLRFSQRLARARAAVSPLVPWCSMRRGCIDSRTSGGWKTTSSYWSSGGREIRHHRGGLHDDVARLVQSGHLRSTQSSFF